MSGPPRGDIGDRLLGRDVLEHDAQFGHAAAQRVEHPLDEHRLAVEDVDLGVGHLAVDQQRHAERRHALQHRHDPVDIGDAVRRVRRRVRRVELDRREHALLIAARDFVRIGAVGQVAGHQRREIGPVGQRREDALAILPRRRDRRHRRHQVRHHDRARELPRRPRHDLPQHRAVAQMHVPVVGPAEGDRIGHRASRHPLSPAGAALSRAGGRVGSGGNQSPRIWSTLYRAARNACSVAGAISPCSPRSKMALLIALGVCIRII